MTHVPLSTLLAAIDRALDGGHGWEALARTHEALRRHPASGLLRLRLARAHEALGDRAAAETALREAYALSPRLAGAIRPETGPEPSCDATETQAPLASIVIPVFNRVEFTQLCLEALITNTPGELFEVILVDNASTDGTSGLLASLEGDVTIIRNAENLGFAAACNQGAKAARGRYVVLLNNDTLPMAGWLEALVLTAEADPAVAVVGAKLLNPIDDKIQHAGMAFDERMVPYHVYLGAPADAPEVNVPRELDMVTGACLLVRRADLEMAGGLDEGYRNGYEDVDLCLRMRLLGRQVRYTPEAVVYHLEGVSEGRHDHDQPNAHRFAAKWQPWFTLGRFKPLAALGGPMASPALPTPTPRPLVSVVMPVHNRLAHTQACLTAFAENTPDGWYELLIVDNASTDGTHEWLATWEGDVTVVTNQTHRGHAKACNQMAAQARGTYVVFLDTDTIPFPGWLEGLVAEAEADETVGVVGGKLLSPDAGHVRHAGLVMGQEGYPVDLLRHAPASHPGTTMRRDLDMVTGACMLVRRDLFERLGGFDDTYDDGFVDVDLCLRVRMTGHTVRFTPHSLLYQIEGAAEGRVDRARDSVTRFQSQWSDAFDQAGRLRGAPMTPTPTPVPPDALPVRWEGDMFAFHSLAAVNRAIASRLVDSGRVELEARPRVAPAFAPSPGSRLWALAGRVNQPLSQPAAVTVRHQWPPNFTPPVEGAFVVMQPWEYGGLPDAWVDGMQGPVDEMWVYTPWLKDCYIRSGMPAERVHVVPLGVDVDRFRPEGATYPFKTQKAFKFLFLGGALPRKGVDVLLNAYMSAFTSEDDVCLVIKGIGAETFYGHIPLHELIVKVVEEARRNPTMPEIEYLDATLADDDIAAMYRACDALVHPYRGEGFGLPVAEAMATGLPVIVTGLGACTAFCDEQTAYLIPAREVPAPMADQGPSAAGYWWSEPDGEALARLMRHVWEHPEEAREVALRGQDRIRAGFTWDHTAHKVQERLAHLAARTPRRL